MNMSSVGVVFSTVLAAKDKEEKIAILTKYGVSPAVKRLYEIATGEIELADNIGKGVKANPESVTHNKADMYLNTIGKMLPAFLKQDRDQTRTIEVVFPRYLKKLSSVEGQILLDAIDGKMNIGLDMSDIAEVLGMKAAPKPVKKVEEPVKKEIVEENEEPKELDGEDSKPSKSARKKSK